MCEEEQPDREWRSFLTDMIERGESVLSFTQGLNVETSAK